MNDLAESLADAWERIRDGLISVIELPIVLVALIGAGLLHGAVTLLEWLDLLTPEKEEE